MFIDDTKIFRMVKSQAEYEEFQKYSSKVGKEAGKKDKVQWKENKYLFTKSINSS